MNSSLNEVRALWERCIFDTMRQRQLSGFRSTLYYTEDGSIVFDAKQSLLADLVFVDNAAAIIDAIVKVSGFVIVNLYDPANVWVWKKGGEA